MHLGSSSGRRSYFAGLTLQTRLARCSCETGESLRVAAVTRKQFQAETNRTMPLTCIEWRLRAPASHLISHGAALYNYDLLFKDFDSLSIQ